MGVEALVIFQVKFTLHVLAPEAMVQGEPLTMETVPDGAVIFTVTFAVVGPDAPFIHESVYVVATAIAGATTLPPAAGATAPTPWLIEQLVTFETTQERVGDEPERTDGGPVKEVMVGAGIGAHTPPLQLVPAIHDAFAMTELRTVAPSRTWMVFAPLVMA